MWMRLNTILRIGLVPLLIVSLGGCATKMQRSTCAMIGAGLGAVGGGVGGGIYSHDHHGRDHNQLEGAGIALGSTLVGAGVGYLLCKTVEEPKPMPEPQSAAPAPAPLATAVPAPSVPDACASALATRIEGVHFANDSSEITPQAGAALGDTVVVLQSCPEERASLNAYTDSSGSDTYNQDLSQRRAESVRTYLIEQGIPESRIEAHGFGELNPVADNGTPEGRAENRRVEIQFLD
jgi:OOP family OmpA-OmpF porin